MTTPQASTPQFWLALARLSVTSPIEAGRALLALNLPPAVGWMALGAVICVGTVLSFASLLIGGGAEESGALSPWQLVGLQLASTLVIAFAVTFVGRLFRGEGQFSEAVLLLTWMQALLLVVQFVLLLIPGLEGLAVLLTMILYLWLLTGFICALHGFRSQALVLVGVFGSIFAFSFVLAFLLLLLGIDPSGFLPA